jgi:GNAT superfamily N-acetyltransferase
MMASSGFETRRARIEDAAAIAAAHRDAIESIGPRYYPPHVVQAWRDAISPDLYVEAMQSGEAFFVATGLVDGEPAVLGFATNLAGDVEDDTSVYVRGAWARHGVGTALLRLAEANARAHGAASICIQASLAGVRFYEINGYEEFGRGEAILTSGQPMACVFMRKRLT